MQWVLKFALRALPIFTGQFAGGQCWYGLTDFVHNVVKCKLHAQISCNGVHECPLVQPLKRQCVPETNTMRFLFGHNDHMLISSLDS